MVANTAYGISNYEPLGIQDSDEAETIHGWQVGHQVHAAWGQDNRSYAISLKPETVSASRAMTILGQGHPGPPRVDGESTRGGGK